MTNPYSQQQPGGYGQPPAAPAPGVQPPSGAQPVQPGMPGQVPAPDQQPVPGQPQMPYGQPSGGFPAQQPVAPGHPGGAFPSPAAPAGFGGQGGFPGQGFGAGPRNYANWGQRAGAYLIDGLPPAVLMLIGYILLFSGAMVVGVILLVLASIGSLGWTIYNRWIKAGNTGQSLGKQVLGVQLIGEQTGQPIGAGNAFLRDLAHILDGIACYLGYLWPLWDEKSQTFSDKILGTIVVQADQGGPGGGQGFPQQQGGFPQQQGFPPQQGGYPQQQGLPQQPGGFPPQQGTGFPAQPQSGGFPQQQPGAPGGYGQPPQQW